MIDLDKYDESFVKDMSTIKFARSVWPQMVRELRAAREVVSRAGTLNARRESNHHEEWNWLADALGAYNDATKGEP